MAPPHIRLLSPSSSSPCPPPVGLLLRPIIPLALAADQGHGGIVFIFSVLQTIVHPHSPHAVRPFTSPLSTVLSTTNDFHLIVAFIATSQFRTPNWTLYSVHQCDKLRASGQIVKHEAC